MSAARNWPPPAWHEMAPVPVDGIEPPHNDDAEERVIEACIAVPGFIDRVAPPLTPEAFYRPGPETIFRGCLAVRQNGTVDELSLIEWLRGRSLLEKAGGAKRCAARANLSEYDQRSAAAAAVRVFELAHARHLALHAQQVVAAVYTQQWGDGGVKGFAESVEARTFELCRAAVRGSETTSAREGFAQFLRDALAQTPSATVSSGFRAYDDAVGEMPMGEYTVVGAATGQGKTAWGLNVAVNVALRGHGVLFVSTEMLARDLMMRAACAFADVPAIAIRRRNLTPLQQQRIIGAAERFRELPIHIDDNFGQTMASIRSQVRRTISALAKQQKKLALVVVDYLQDVKGAPASKTFSEEQRLRDLSRDLADLARVNSVHVLALSQLNDNANMRTGKGAQKPDLPDLKGSKAISFPAQVVAFLHREKVDGKYLGRGPAELWIRKARFASAEPIDLTFDAVLGRFENAEET